MSAFSHRHLTTARLRRCSGVAWLTASTCSAFVLPLAEAQTREARNLEEVIVTAQKREENLQNVPISISVLGGNDLDQSSVEGVTEALRTVPGVATTVHYQGGGTQVSVRGVAANGASLFCRFG